MPCRTPFEYQEHFHLSLRADTHESNRTPSSGKHQASKPAHDLRSTNTTLLRTAHTTTLRYSAIAHQSNGSLRSLDVLPASNRAPRLSLARNNTVVLGHLHDHIRPIPHHQLCQNGEPAKQARAWNALVRKAELRTGSMNVTDSVRSQDHPLRHHRRRSNRDLCLDRGAPLFPAPLIPRRRDTEGFHPFRPLSHWYDRHGIAALRTHHQSVSRRSVQRSERGLSIVATAEIDVRGLVRGVRILCCGHAVRGLDLDCGEAGACEVDLVWRIRMQDDGVRSGKCS